MEWCLGRFLLHRNRVWRLWCSIGATEREQEEDGEKLQLDRDREWNDDDLFWRNLGLLLLEETQNMGNRCFMFLSVGLSCPQARGIAIYPGFWDFVWKVKMKHIVSVHSTVYLRKYHWLGLYCKSKCRCDWLLHFKLWKCKQNTLNVHCDSNKPQLPSKL